ncbi:hypothetical protein Tco_0327216, partial [Tanacetum coccineum]
MKEKEVQAIKEIERQLQKSEMQKQESLVSKGTTLEDCIVADAVELEACLITEGAAIEACLVTKGATLEACLVNEGIAVNDNTNVMKSSRTESENNSLTTPFSRSEDENRSSDKDCNSSRNECNKSGNENRSSDHESTSSRKDANADIGPSYDCDIVIEVNENNSNIIYDIPNIDLDRNKEEHDDVNYEQQHAFFASLINNLKCDVEKCNEVSDQDHLTKSDMVYIHLFWCPVDRKDIQKSQENAKTGKHGHGKLKSVQKPEAKVKKSNLGQQKYGYIKNHKKTVKNGQARTRESEEYKRVIKSRKQSQKVKDRSQIQSTA